MTKVKAVLLIASALFMLAACGESFRAKQVSSEAANETGQQVNTNPSTTGPVDPIQSTAMVAAHQTFANRYTSLLSNTAATQTMVNLIQAFSVTKRLASPSVDRVTLEANIATGCGNLVVVRGTINITDLRVNQPIRLGPQNFFTVDVQCNDINCDNMSAAIMNNDGGDRVVLTGLVRNAGKSSTTVHQMEPTGVTGVTGYNFFNNVIDYSISCNPSTNTVIDPSNSGNNSGGNFIIDPTGGIAPTNNGETINNGELESFFSL